MTDRKPRARDQESAERSAGKRKPRLKRSEPVPVPRRVPALVDVLGRGADWIEVDSDAAADSWDARKWTRCG